MFKNYFSVADLVVYLFLFFFFSVIGSLISSGLIAKYGAEMGVENMGKIAYIPTFLLIVTSAKIYRTMRCHTTQSPCRFVGGGRLSPNSVLLGIVLMIAISIVIDPLSHYFNKDMADYVKLFTTGNMWVTLCVTVLIAPILEEIFFRGILLKDISVSWGPRWGIFISSVIFSALHFNIIQAIPAFLMGLVFGYIYVHTRYGLTNVIMIHIINNLMASVSLFWGFGEVSIWQRYLSHEAWYRGVYGVAALLVLFLMVRVITISGKSLINKRKNG